MVNFTNYGYPIEIHSTWGTYESAFLIVTLSLAIITGVMACLIYRQIKQQGKEIQQNIKMHTLEHIKKMDNFVTKPNHFDLYIKLVKDYDKETTDYSNEKEHVLQILNEVQQFLSLVHFIPLNIEVLNQTIGPSLKRVIHNPGVDLIIKEIQEDDKRYFNVFDLVDKDLHY